MKTWEKPKLIALVRSRPEEAVLYFCKWYETFTGAVANQTACWGLIPGTDVCGYDQCWSLVST